MRFKKSIFSMTFSLIVSIALSTASYSSILIVSPMQKEYQPVKALITQGRTQRINAIPIRQGFIGTTPVIAAQIGIGAVNAAANMALLIQHFHPTGIILSGIAGSLTNTIPVNAIVIGQTIFATGMGVHSTATRLVSQITNPQRPDQPVPLILHSNAQWLQHAQLIYNKFGHPVILGSIATTQQYPDNVHLRQQLQQNKVDALAMEDFAVAQIAWTYRLPFMDVRAISDNPNSSYTQYRAKKAAQTAAEFVKLWINMAPHE